MLSSWHRNVGRGIFAVQFYAGEAGAAEELRRRTPCRRSGLLVVVVVRGVPVLHTGYPSAVVGRRRGSGARGPESGGGAEERAADEVANERPGSGGHLRRLLLWHPMAGQCHGPDAQR